MWGRIVVVEFGARGTLLEDVEGRDWRGRVSDSRFVVMAAGWFRDEPDGLVIRLGNWRDWKMEMPMICRDWVG